MKKLLTLLLISICVIANSQSGTEIYLFDLQVENNQVTISNPQNISNHPGYDNQPYFHHNKPILYYASFNEDGRSDIKYYNFQNEVTKNLTITNEREYSPTLTPDGKFISCIIQRDNGQQDLGKYPVDGGEPVVLTDKYLVGYHAWIDETKVLMYILNEDSGELHFVNFKTNEDVILATNIGRSLHKIPTQNAMSYIDKSIENNWRINKIDIAFKSISTIVSTLPQQENITWTQNGFILMSDGNQIYFYKPGSSKSWIPIKTKGDLTGIKGITRMAVNPENNKLAVVVSE